ncbi:hypothetical protein K435DRAFT_202779 [Dendrothele bispora CBS 962.96]|uniref:Uncharacterized protein n=1 Tax=Dendrothele bispora (strain CBS 962.96) TaxID=1314807 RepID=A0A4S8LUB0_DENBC|nr:hypothetical protein K435DRAFT_202779 [Dendrothele bispora CBS 962.96]
MQDRLRIRKGVLYCVYDPLYICVKPYIGLLWGRVQRIRFIYIHTRDSHLFRPHTCSRVRPTFLVFTTRTNPIRGTLIALGLAGSKVYKVYCYKDRPISFNQAISLETRRKGTVMSKGTRSIWNGRKRKEQKGQSHEEKIRKEYENATYSITPRCLLLPNQCKRHCLLFFSEREDLRSGR